MIRRMIFLSLLLLWPLAACMPAAEKERPEKSAAPLVLTPVAYNDLPGWGRDDYEAALGAFAKSCARILRADPARSFSNNIEAGTFAQWQEPCRVLQGGITDARAFFETWFTPYQASAEFYGTEGLFTGYYEAALNGSRTRGGAYQTPLHKRPADLVMVELGEFRDDLKGQRIAGRVRDGKLRPYEDRAQIITGQWPHNDEGDVLVWVDDPVDAFFVQIQGSGVVQMDDGSVMRIGYDGQNGHAYYAIGRELVKRGYMAKEDVSMQSIRTWLTQNPGEGIEIMNLNRSYVFMREITGEGPHGGALGAENVVLTAGRSLAVDNGKMAYGVPLWVDIGPPAAGEEPINRLMIAQDTGGAIKGAVRGDVYFGYGERAAYLAGQMKAPGRYWLLLPRALREDL